MLCSISALLCPNISSPPLCFLHSAPALMFKILKPLMLVQTFHNKTVSALKFQVQNAQLVRTILQTSQTDSLSLQTMPVHSWSEPSLQTSNFHSSFKYHTLLLIWDIYLNGKLVRLNLQTIWSEQVCKPVVFILHPQYHKQCTFHFLSVVPPSATQISKNLFFRSFELNFRPSFQINQAMLFPFFISHTSHIYHTLLLKSWNIFSLIQKP